MTERRVEDQLREEYFELLPDMRRVSGFLETKVRYALLPIFHALDKYERVEVVSRIKDCESALDKLRRGCEGGVFDPDAPEPYTLTALNELAGVRVLAFPRSRLTEINEKLRRQFSEWMENPFTNLNEPEAFKYCGTCTDASDKVTGELQILPMLLGLFWEVEHSAIYKPAPELKGVDRLMHRHAQEVVTALRNFEQEFERQIQRSMNRRNQTK